MTEAKQKPILFDSDSVKALLTCAKCGKVSVPFPCEHCGSTEFSKTQTRRLMNPQPPECAGAWSMSHGAWRDTMAAPCQRWKPRYQEGELGYVREAWMATYDRAMDGKQGIRYAADDAFIARVHTGVYWDADHVGRWRPSIHMPKWAARLWVEFGPNRPPERVQKITHGDITAEGIPCLGNCPGACYERWIARWNGIHGKDAWGRNEFVWPYQFKRVEVKT